MKKKLPINYGYLAIALVFLTGLFFLPKFAQAVNLTTALIRFDRMKISQNNVNILVAVRPSTLTTTNKIKVALSNYYTLTTTAGSIATSTVGVTNETLSGASICNTTMPLTGSIAAAVSGTSIDFSVTSGQLSTSSVYCFYITAGVGTGSTAGNSLENRVEELNNSTINETSRVATAIISDDQVTVSAVVPAIFTFALSANSTVFTGDLSPSSTGSTSGVTATVGTNANSGWVAWLKDTTTFLFSATANSSIPTTGTQNGTPATLTNGTSAYVLDVDSGTGSPTVDAEYNGSSTGGGTFSSSALQRIAYGTTATAGDTIVLYGRATISALQKAGTDYSDTWTVVAAGQF